MKKTYAVLIVLFFLLLNKNVYASTTAKSAVVVDIDSGRVLYEKDKDTKRLIASITKIMTI